MEHTLKLNQNTRNQKQSNVNYNMENNSEKLPTFTLDTVTTELFDTTADKTASIISNSKVNNSSQLRRFYDELLLWYERANVDDEAFKSTLPFIYMMKSKVAYAVGRKNVDEIFQAFMNNLINQIKDRKTLKNAKLFMEAVMGFYKQHRPNDK